MYEPKDKLNPYHYYY